MDCYYFDEVYELQERNTQYARHFDMWLKDFKETSSYAGIVTGHDGHWIKIYNELHQIFKDTVWNPMELRNEAPTEETSTEEDEYEDDPRLRMDADQKDNYTRQFHLWLHNLKDTCPDLKLFNRGFRNIRELNKLNRFFMLHHWDPEKTVDEN